MSTYTKILVAKVWRRNLDYVKNLQVKYFISENIPIYGIILLLLLLLYSWAEGLLQNTVTAWQS